MSALELVTQENKLQKIKESGLPVIIFGADVVGEAIYFACREQGIEVAFFCDNNKNKIKWRQCGLEIVHAPEIVNRVDDAEILIASTYIKDIIRQLENELGFNRWYDCSVFLQNFDLYRYEDEYSREMHFIDFAVNACLLSHSGFMDPDQLYIRGIDLIITEKCSMKCKDCSNLMQYYEKPVNMELDEMFDTIDGLCSVADEIYEMRVIGGEPLVNKQYHMIVDKLNNEPKVKRVVIYSNGTILPKKEHLPILANDKVIFIITNYGELSRNLDRITEAFDEHNVEYVVQKAAGWTDSGHLKKYGRTDEELTEQFRYCCVKNYTSVSEGKLYRCPFAANAARLNATPDDPEDYFDLSGADKSYNALIDTKHQIRDYLTNKKFLRACDYCNGRTYGMPEIEPGIQTIKPLEYMKHDQDAIES